MKKPEGGLRQVLRREQKVKKGARTNVGGFMALENG